MIDILYSRSDHSVSISGHSGTGKELGEDIVCAAVTALAQTLAGNVRDLSANHGAVRRPKTELDYGTAEISCSAVHGFDNVVTLIFDSICAGFKLLSEQYPENVSFRAKG